MCSKLKSHPSLAAATNPQLMCLPFQALSISEISSFFFWISVDSSCDCELLISCFKRKRRVKQRKQENVWMQAHGERKKQRLAVDVAKCCLVNKRTATQEMRAEKGNKSERKLLRILIIQ